MKEEHLPFWSFFHDIEKALSYERWIDKYKLFIQALTSNQILFDKDLFGFKQFCKALYLQNHQDEPVFESLLNKAIVREQEWLASFIETSTPIENGNIPIAENKPGADALAPEIEQKIPEKPVDAESSFNEASAETSGIRRAERTMYYLPPFEQDKKNEISKEAVKAVNYLFTGEYFPVTRRQMVKAWQFLRLKEKGTNKEGLDIIATTKKIARDGLFLNPVYNFSLRNRQDALIIFADYRGSMAPFHELTNRLISTALGEGGHQRAPVYYFQNYPVGYVYKKSNLTEPLKLKEALLKTNRNFTLAIVISDAGAARGSTGGETREKMTTLFLNQLDESCAHTIWLNPMPAHRWKNTAAELIRKKVFLMAPVLEYDSYNFQDTLRAILKQNLKK